MKIGLSVVMATLGGDLTRELQLLNGGSLVPNEIIICLPNRGHKVIDRNAPKNKNVRIIYAETYGQVKQRLFGFKHVKYNHVFQIDDKCYLEVDCFQKMMESIDNITGKAAVAPYWKNIDDKQPFCNGKRSGLYMSLYYWILNGNKRFAPGEISLAGTEFCVNYNDVKRDTRLLKVEWQPGGGILHKTENLYLEDYYPWVGKAYSEDLFHSYYLRKNGVDLFVDFSAIAYCDKNEGIKISKALWKSFKVRYSFVKLAKLNVFRMLIYFLIYIIKPILKIT